MPCIWTPSKNRGFIKRIVLFVHSPEKTPEAVYFLWCDLEFLHLFEIFVFFKKIRNPVFFIKTLYLQSSFSFLHKTFSVLYTCKCLPIIHAVWGLFPPPLFLLRQIPFPATLLCFEHYSHYSKNKVLYRDWACSIRNPRVNFWFFHGTYWEWTCPFSGSRFFIRTYS